MIRTLILFAFLISGRAYALDCQIFNESHFEQLPMTKMARVDNQSPFTYDLALDAQQSVHFELNFNLTLPQQYAFRAENHSPQGADDVLAIAGGNYDGSFLVLSVKTPQGLLTINCAGAKWPGR